MPNFNNKDELDSYIDDLVLNRQDHENDDPLEVAGALIYAIQTREHFNEEFSYYLKNISYTEKKQIKDTIKYNNTQSNTPITDTQKRLFEKLINSLPEDSVAKKTEIRRKQEDSIKLGSDIEFLEKAVEEVSSLKRKVGEELKKKNVDNVKLEQYTSKIAEVQKRVLQLTRSNNISIKKDANLVSIAVMDTQSQLQDKLNNLAGFHQQTQTSENVTSDELNKIQTKLITNSYAYNHIPLIREETDKVLKQVRKIREEKLNPNNKEQLSTLESLKLHKQWDDKPRFENPKFGKLAPEYIPEGFYVMHGASEGEKNDIKMHVSIDPDQANIAMDILSEMSQSDEYANLIQEFKIGDIDHIKERNRANTQIVNDKLTQLFAEIPGIDIQKVIKDLKENPDVDYVVRDILEKVPNEKREIVGNVLKDLKHNNIGAIISGERILNEALLTVYFKKDMTKEDLEKFSLDLTKRLQEKGVKNGLTAKTDVSINPYCGITIDHIIENDKKIYLEGDNPEHVKKRQKALRDNPLTKGLVPQGEVLPQHISQLHTMAMHEDPKDNNGMSAFTVKGLSEIPLKERVDLAGLLVAERFKQTNNVNLVYRNPDMHTKWVVKEILNELKFPVDKNDKVNFFTLVEKAIGTPPDEASITQLKEYFKDPKPEIVQMLAPFYHEYLESVKKEFDANYKQNDKLPRDEKRQQYYQVREERLNEAKKQFLGHVSFPFVESLVFELSEKDGFPPSRKGKLAQGVRSLREQGMMDPLIKALDTKNDGYVPPLVNPETINKAFEIYQKGTNDYMDVKREHRQVMLPVEQRATELYKIVNKIASSFPKDSEFKEIFERYAGSIENIKTELDHMLLRGEKITEQDLKQVHTLFDAVMGSVKQGVNATNSRGESILHEAIRNGNKDLVEVLLKAGADPRMQTPHYKRGILGALKDAFTAKSGGFFKNLTTSPSRTATEFANFFGNNEITNLLRTKETEMDILEKERQETLMQELGVVEHNLVEKSKDQSMDLNIDSIEKPEEHPTVVTDFKLHTTDIKKDKEKSPFVAGWEMRINEELTVLGDGKITSEQNNVAIYALKQIKSLMEARIDLAPPELDKLNAVINRVTNEARIPFPSSVKLMIRQMSEGTVLPSEKVISQKLTGPKTEFVQMWEEHLNQLMTQSSIPKYFLNQIKDYLDANPAMTADKLDGLNVVLKRIEKEANDIKPELKQVIEGMRKGKLPEEPPRESLRVK